eukprot:s1_g623.t1
MGAAAAAEIIALGGTVTLVGRNQKRLSELVDQLGPDATSIVADLSNEGTLKEVLQSESGLCHIVVALSANAAASSIGSTGRRDAETAFSRFWASYEVLHVAPNVLPSTGSVTLISGSSARTPAPGYGVWTALHGSIESLARAASIDIAPIRVNVVSPGGISMAPDRQLVERSGAPSDIGLAIALTITNPAMTGSVVDVDSGERKGAWGNGA